MFKVKRAEICNHDYEVDIEKNGVVQTYSLVEADDLYGKSNMDKAINNYLKELK